MAFLGGTSFLVVYAAVATALIRHHVPEYLILGSTTLTFVTGILTLFGLSFTYNVILYPKFLSPLRDLPMPPDPEFIMGHGRTIIKEPTGIPARRWINSVPNSGLIRYLHIFNQERIITVSPKALSEVLVTKSYDFPKPDRSRTALVQLLGNGVLVAEGDAHKFQRKNLMPAFKYHHVRDLYPIFWSKSGEMINVLSKEISTAIESDPSLDAKGGYGFEMGNWLSRCTLDLIGIAGLGFDFQAIQDPHNHLNEIYRTVFSPSGGLGMRLFLAATAFFPPWLMQRIPIKRNKQLAKARHEIRAISRKVIEDKQASLKKASSNFTPSSGSDDDSDDDDQPQRSQQKDILSVALSSGAFTIENLVDQTMTFLAAGHETTATVSAWALLELAQRPSLQSALRAEIRAALPSFSDCDEKGRPLKTNIPMTADLMDKSCPLLHAVCSETLRFHAPVPMTRREAAVDTTLCGHPIPKGTTVFICPWAVNFSTEQWGSDAGEFRPERWLVPEGEGKEAHAKAAAGGAESNFSNLTFLHGPRSCIGMGFARAEFACLLAAVVGRLEIVLDLEEIKKKGLKVGEVQTGVVARPKGGLRVRGRVVGGW